MLKLGIIGQPLTHSLSPVLHGAILDALGLQGEYRKYEIQPECLATELRALAQTGVCGLNVTIPHKVAVMPLLDSLSPEADLAGAVNTIVFSENGQLQQGYNTDIEGFLRGLPAQVSDRLPESHVLILGAGGSSRAVLTALTQQQSSAITFAVRNPDKALPLLAHAATLREAYQVNTTVNIVSLDSLPALEAFNGLINTTPVGMYPQAMESPLTRLQLETLPAGAFVYDLIYRPAQTQLLRDAAALGLTAINGLDMLLYQGVCAFELWQERKVPESLIPRLRHALTSALAASVS